MAETDPLNVAATFGFDAAGRETSATDRAGRRREFGFDDAGRVLTEVWYAAGGALVQTQTWTYDAVGRMLTAQDPDGTYTLTYDARGFVRFVEEPFGLSLTMGYDAVGNRTTVRDSKGGFTTVTFDALGRQQGQAQAGTGVSATRSDTTYTARGQTETVTRYSDVAGASVVATTTHDYDPAGRETHLTHASAAGSTLAEFTYTYDAADRLLTKVENGTTTSFGYDAADQLTQDGVGTFGYDGTGNRTNAGYGTGVGNRISTDGVSTFTHDPNGNLTQNTVGAAGATWAWTYDHRNQMTGAAFSATPGGTVTARVTYSYDAFGVRIGRAAWDGTTTTVARYGVDGWNPAKPAPIGTENFDTWVDLDGANSLVTRRTFSAEFDGVVSRQDAGGAVAYYLTDRQGSVRLLIDNSATPLATTTYDAFGAIAGGALDDRFGYTGQELDPTTGDWDFNGRTYSSTLHLFLQADPIWTQTGEPNPYTYTLNSPTNRTDPSGLDKLDAAGPRQTAYWKIVRSSWHESRNLGVVIGQLSGDGNFVHINFRDTVGTLPKSEVISLIARNDMSELNDLVKESDAIEAVLRKAIDNDNARFKNTMSALDKQLKEMQVAQPPAVRTAPIAVAPPVAVAVAPPVGVGGKSTQTELDGASAGLHDTATMVLSLPSVSLPMLPNIGMAVYEGDAWHLVPFYTAGKTLKGMHDHTVTQYEGYRRADHSVFTAGVKTVGVTLPHTHIYVNGLEMVMGRSLHGDTYGELLCDYDYGKKPVEMLRDGVFVYGPKYLATRSKPKIGEYDTNLWKDPVERFNDWNKSQVGERMAANPNAYEVIVFPYSGEIKIRNTVDGKFVNGKIVNGKVEFGGSEELVTTGRQGKLALDDAAQSLNGQKGPQPGAATPAAATPAAPKGVVELSIEHAIDGRYVDSGTGHTLQKVEAAYKSKPPTTQVEMYEMMDKAAKEAGAERGRNWSGGDYYRNAEGDMIIKNVLTETTVKPNGEAITRKKVDGKPGPIIQHLKPQ